MINNLHVSWLGVGDRVSNDGVGDKVKDDGVGANVAAAMTTKTHRK
jgi:hypothetical protein